MTATMPKGESMAEAVKRPPKISVDDKTVFMKDGVPISP